MRLWGWLFLLGGIGLVVFSLNLDFVAIVSAGSLDVLADPELPLNKVRFALIGGFAFVGGSVLIGCASVASAFARPPERD